MYVNKESTFYVPQSVFDETQSEIHKAMRKRQCER